MRAGLLHIPRDSRAPVSGLAWAGARGLALFLGGFTLANLAGNLRATGFDLNLWWIDVRWIPAWLANPFLAVSGLLLVLFAARPGGSRLRRRATLGCAGALAAVALVNACSYYWLVFGGSVRPAVPIPLSLLVAGSLGLILHVARRETTPPGRWRGAPGALAAFGAVTLLFPLLQMLLFGTTDYRRAGDVAVVFGARTYADGRLSDALEDRVRTACELYRHGLVGKVIMSGGPGDGAIHETEAMARRARDLGVRAEDLLLDKNGLNTAHTTRNTLPLLKELGARRVLAVSHGYHLPRVKLAYQRAGLEVYTVPAHESYFLRQMPFNMAREIAAIWAYYWRPLAAAR